MKNKEFGSDFHWVEVGDFRNIYLEDDFVNSIDQLFFSGRAALYHLLKMGINNKGWKKIYVPTYYCQEVYHFIQDLSIEIVYYNYNPLENQMDLSVEDEASNLVLVVNYFGMRNPKISNIKKAIIIEDLTHDLSKINDSQADYIFGSLRKELPLPVGGFLKCNHDKIENLFVSSKADLIATQKYTGMFLKSKYLQGEFHSKDIFRQLLMDGEQNFENSQTYSAMPKQVVEYLKSLSVKVIMNQKINNIESFKKCVIQNDKFELFTSENDTDFALTLKFKDHKDRNQMRTHLVNHMIYPMILWPNQIKENDKAIEDTLLFIHADFRHSESDILYISKIINDFIKN